MAFAPGDKVVHRYHGPGRVARLDRVQARDETRECYVVDMGHGLVVWVPIDGTSEQSLRAPLSVDSLARLADILRSPAQPMEAAHRDREQQIKLLMRDGSPEVLCALVRDLSAQCAGRSPNANTLAVLDKARRMLIAEWELATDAPDAAAEVDALLRESASHSNAETA